MDEIDSKQQEEIESLKRKDVAHDSSLGWMISALKFVVFAFIMWVIVSSSLIFVLMDKLSK